jgi:hypothetical protein
MFNIREVSRGWKKVVGGFFRHNERVIFNYQIPEEPTSVSMCEKDESLQKWQNGKMGNNKMTVDSCN